MAGYRAFNPRAVRSPAVHRRLSSIAAAAATGVEIHPGAEHSFMRPDLQRKEPANATASRLSWPQSVAFLDACLAPKS